MRVPAAGFRIIQGMPKRFFFKQKTAYEITRAFCGDCGSPLYVQVSTRPDIIGLRVGTLDDPSGFPADADIFVRSAPPWDHITPALPQYATYPPGKSYQTSDFPSTTSHHS